MSKADPNRPGCCICQNKPTIWCKDGYYCNKHYQSMIHWGQPYGHPREKTNKYEISGDVLTITTKDGTEILADADDYEKICKYSWCISKTGYAVANIENKTTKMHRYILGINDPDILVDHKNHNTLDNRKKNIRTCNHAENCRNKTVSATCRSGHLGVKRTPNNTFSVRITCNYKEIHVGNYKTIEDAIEARRQAEIKYHGEFAASLSKEDKG